MLFDGSSRPSMALINTRAISRREQRRPPRLTEEVQDDGATKVRGAVLISAKVTDRPADFKASRPSSRTATSSKPSNRRCPEAPTTLVLVRDHDGHAVADALRTSRIPVGSEKRSANWAAGKCAGRKETGLYGPSAGITLCSSCRR